MKVREPIIDYSHGGNVPRVTLDGPETEHRPVGIDWAAVSRQHQNDSTQWLDAEIRGIQQLIYLLPVDMRQGLLDRVARLENGVRSLLMEKVNY